MSRIAGAARVDTSRREPSEDRSAPSSRSATTSTIQRIVVGLVTGVVVATSIPAVAQTDEIQVYDASHAEPGIFNLTWHNNFTPSGIKTTAFPDAVTADKSWNGVTEWAYGVTPWFETGLYLPLYTVDK